MESRSQPSAIAIQELIDSMKELHKTELGCDVKFTFTHKGGDYERSAHVAIICPRSSYFMDALNLDIKNRRINVDQCWHIGEWEPSVVGKMLQYLYELDYQVDIQDGTAPDLSTHAELWCLGKHLGIGGLKAVASDRFKVALSLFNVYGSEVDFKFSYFEDLVKAVEAVWKLVPEPTRFLRNQISIHIQQNIKEWAEKEGSQSRFLESTYRLIFRETEQQDQKFKAMMDNVRAEYLLYVDIEGGSKGVRKDKKEWKALVKANKY